jgi:hypothetical protein
LHSSLASGGRPANTSRSAMIHPQDAGTVECDVLHLRIGLGMEVHDDPPTTPQKLQPLAALTESGHLGREAGLEVGLALGGGRILASPPDHLLKPVEPEVLPTLLSRSAAVPGAMADSPAGDGGEASS